MKQLERDTLTGAYGRAAFQPLLNDSQQAFEHQGLAFSIVVIDLDHFKSINDAFGHHRGDDILVGLVTRIQAELGEQDSLIRYGGDEFVLIIRASKAQAIALANRILDGIRSEAIAGEPPLYVSVSMGLACMGKDADDADSLFRIADERALISKRQGRGRITHDRVDLGLSFDEEGRLLARDVALEQATSVLANIVQGGSHLLSIEAAAGLGKTRLLKAIKQLAQLQGLSYLEIQGRASLQTRFYGALLESQLNSSEDPFSSPDDALKKLADARQQAPGLVILVDDIQYLDEGTLDFIQARLKQWDQLGLMTTGAPAAMNDITSDRLSLAPFDLTTLKLWLRSSLHDDPPEEFSHWFYEQTQGYPALMRSGLEILVERDLLYLDRGSWQLGSVDKLDLKALITAKRKPPSAVLPNWPGAFLGRTQDLDQIKSLLTRSRLVSILGPGGIGKSRLASQVGREVQEQFAGGVYFVALADVHDVNSFYSHVAQALALSLVAVSDIEAQVFKALKDKPSLLILDNLEHLFALLPTLLELLAHCPQLSLVVTSQEALRLEQEQIYTLTGLDLPDSADDQALEHYGAIQLFQQKAQAGHSFDLEKQGREHVLRICQLTEGVPLLLELAAAWTSIFSCQHIANQLEKNVGFLEQTPGQQGRIWRMLDYFWSLLSLYERRVLAKMTIFQEGFRAEAAENVADASLFFLLALLDRSFVKQEDERFFIHPLLKQYAQQSVDINTQALQARHARYFSSVAQELNSQQRDGDNALTYARVDQELANFQLAWSWFVNKQDIQGLYPLAKLLRGYHDVRGLTQAGFASYAQAVDQLVGVAEQAPVAYGWLLEAKSLFMIHLGRTHEAEDVAQQSLAILTPEGPSEALAMASNTLGMLAHKHQDYRQARDYFQRSIDTHEAYNNPKGMIRALGNLAYAIEDLGDKEAAKATYHRVIQLSQEQGMHGSQAISLHNLGQMHHQAGELALAESCFQEGLRLAQGITYPRLEAHLLLALGQLSNQQGKFGQALTQLDQAEQLFQNLHESNTLVTTLLAKARSQLGLGEQAKASECFYAGLDLIDIHQLTGHATAVALNAALLWLAQSRFDEAALLSSYLGAQQKLPSAVQSELEVLQQQLASQISQERLKHLAQQASDLEAADVIMLAREKTSVMV